MAEAQRLIGISLAKIAQSRVCRGGVSLHKNLLVATVLQKARYIFMEEAYHIVHGHYLQQQQQQQHHHHQQQQQQQNQHHHLHHHQQQQHQLMHEQNGANDLASHERSDSVTDSSDDSDSNNKCSASEQQHYQQQQQQRNSMVMAAAAAAAAAAATAAASAPPTVPAEDDLVDPVHDEEEEEEEENETTSSERQRRRGADSSSSSSSAYYDCDSVILPTTIGGLPLEPLNMCRNGSSKTESEEEEEDDEEEEREYDEEEKENHHPPHNRGEGQRADHHHHHHHHDVSHLFLLPALAPWIGTASDEKENIGSGVAPSNGDGGDHNPAASFSFLSTVTSSPYLACLEDEEDEDEDEEEEEDTCQDLSCHHRKAEPEEQTRAVVNQHVALGRGGGAPSSLMYFDVEQDRPTVGDRGTERRRRRHRTEGDSDRAGSDGASCATPAKRRRSSTTDWEAAVQERESEEGAPRGSDEGDDREPVPIALLAAKRLKPNDVRRSTTSPPLAPVGGGQPQFYSSPHETICPGDADALSECVTQQLEAENLSTSGSSSSSSSHSGSSSSAPSGASSGASSPEVDRGEEEESEEETDEGASPDRATGSSETSNDQQEEEGGKDAEDILSSPASLPSSSVESIDRITSLVSIFSFGNLSRSVSTPDFCASQAQKDTRPDTGSMLAGQLQHHGQHGYLTMTV